MKRIYCSYKLYMTYMLSFLLMGTLSAQIDISGVVIDDSDEPLIGVTIIIKGSTNGTVTDFDGSYQLTANQGDILEYSYVGYESQDVLVGVENNINITLLQGLLIEEIVVTGYSVDTRRKTSGSVSTLKSEALTITPSGNVEQQLQGRIPGVTVVSNGQPGTTSQVRVRGYGALGGNAPLYVVDGVPVSSTNFLSPNDIESTTVLKDATSASIYGARAAGGVIVYTTKKGKKGKKKLSISYNGTFGVTTPGTGGSVLNPQEQADWTWTAIRNSAIQLGVEPEYSHPQYGTGSTPVLPDYLKVGSMAGVTGSVDLADEMTRYNIDPELGAVYQVIKANKSGTNWYDEITRNAFLQRHNLGFSGGGENSRFYFGLGLQEQEGIVKHQKFTRYSFRVNSEFNLTKNIRIGENLQFTYRSAPLIFGGDGGSGSTDDENVILLASRMSPIIPVFDEFGGYAGTTAPGFNNPLNPIAQLDGQSRNENFTMGTFGNFYLEIEPIKDLVFKSSIGGQYIGSNSRSYSRRTYENSENNSAFSFRQGSGYGSSWVFTNTLTFKKEVGVHRFKFLLGQEALNDGNGTSFSGRGLNPFAKTVDFINLNTVDSKNVGGGNSNGFNFASYFGKIDYDYNDKYIISATVRRDGSSRFGSENRYGVFPAFSVAWRASAEPFFQNVNFIDDLKIRAGYGVMGNSNNVNPNNQYSLFGTSIGASSYDIGGSNGSSSTGFFQNRIGNPSAKWERAVTSNIAIDALLVGGKWDIGLELWNKDTEDLLFQVPITVQNGFFAAAPSQNVGKMRNSGFDFSITNKNKIGVIGYEITLNGGFLSNEIVSLAEGVESLPGRSSSYRGITPVLNREGFPLSSFYGYQVVGLFSDAAEVTSAPTQDGAAPGRFRFADLNGFDEDGELTGVPDGVIDIADRTNLGDPIPDFTGGLSLKLNYKNFQIQMYTFASIGNEIYNLGKLFTDFYPLFPGAAIGSRVKESWTFDNRTGDIPVFENTSNFSTNTQSNSYYVEDGSYFRLQNVTVSYSLPDSFLDKLKFSSVKISASVNNLLTITGYNGLDPSVGGSADTNFGIDLGNFPITRSWTLGLSVGF